MGYFLFLLATAALLIRPSEQIEELRAINLYQALIIPCFLFSIGPVFDQFSLRSVETRPISVCVLGLLVAVILSHLANGSATLAADTGWEFMKILIYYVLLVGNVTTVGRMRGFIYCLGLFAIAFVTIAVLQYHEVLPAAASEQHGALMARTQQGSDSQVGAFVKELDYDPDTGQVTEIKRLRGTGIFRDPNDICLLITMGFFICLYGLSDLQLSAFRLVWLAPAVFFMYALILTQSRGGFLSLLVGVMALFYARFGWRAALALGLPLMGVMVAVVGGRMAAISASEGTGQTRVQIWSDGIAAMLSSPIFGIGMNEMSTIVGKAAHNSFLHAYTELGILGGTLFFGAFFFATWTLLRLDYYRQWLADAELRRLLPFLVALVASYAAGILSLSRVDAVPTYLLLGLVTATATLAMREIPALGLRLNSWLVQRMAVASVGFLAVSYLFVRVMRV
jgi:hypothetical protein